MERGRLEVSEIETYQGIRASIDCCFQNKFIRRIVQLRTPQKMNQHGLRETCQRIQEYRHVAWSESGCVQMGLPGANRLVFDEQAHAGGQIDATLPCHAHQFGRSAGR